jgi:hypothetical protein
MRALGGAAALASQDAELAETDPAERTRRLTDRLVAAVSRPDAALTPPPDLAARISALAVSTGVPSDRLALVAAAVLAGRGLVLTGGDPGLRWQVLARLAEEVFEHAALVARATSPERLVGGPVDTGFGGFVYEAIALNWRRDELDPYRTDAPSPVSRVPVVGDGPGCYRIFRGVWPVLPLEAGVCAASVTEIGLALASGALVGVAGGRLFRLPLPADFRVLLSVNDRESVAGLLPAEVPVVSLVAPRAMDESAALAERERWLGELERRLGPAEDVGESHLRLRLAERVAEVFIALSPSTAVPSTAYAEAVVLAAYLSGSAEDRAEDALLVHVAPRLPRDAAEAVPVRFERLRAAVRRG